MIYQVYQAQSDMVGPARAMAQLAAANLGRPMPGLTEHQLVRRFSALCELLARSGLSHNRPAFGIDRIAVGNREVAVTEETVLQTPFCTLLRFRKDIDTAQPPVLLVAPMSGHFATLLRATVRTILPDHDVYITDWCNARNVSLWHGRFEFADFIEHIMRFLEALGPEAHVVAVCQPCVPVLAAVALMAEAGSEAQPRSMTLMAGPIDTRVNPTKVNELATSKPIEWFERHLIGVVPLRYAGAVRSVYPGFVQLMAFMLMNLDRHVKAHVELFDSLVKGDLEKAAATRAFYDEYLAVMDLPAEFYLETVRLVFQEHALPLGKLDVRGHRVDPRAIRRTFLFTVEGEKDDICAFGQTLAAHELCSGLRPYMRRHRLQSGVGHYGVFSGRRWSNEIYPILRSVIHACA
jgi:poly(3-hydroxybutyrate) depolymerase